ncbi:ABC transporter, ATP-binding protein [Verrucomicrobiia bacterium DG1235]|nr:ABC transporter, ATP-binding protein [Verrucomicrobiae bacterium DG1235]
MRIKSLKRGPLTIDDWTIDSRDTWCVLGGNASGKSLLAAVLAGEISPEAGSIQERPKRCSLISFESLQNEYEQELAKDDSDFLDRIDYGSSGLEILLQSGASQEQAREAARVHGVAPLLKRGCRQFSTGELRRITLLREILQFPDLLILDEPFEGLDSQGREDLHQLVSQIIAQRHSVLLIVNRIEDVSNWCTHLAILDRGRILLAGERQKIISLPETRHLFNLSSISSVKLPQSTRISSPPQDSPLFQLKNIRIQYSDTIQFQSFSWTLRPGKHTLISGPNGCGKSSLLALLTGDHPQSYTNHIEIFGYRRGTGESIWDIKRHIGYLSPALHRDYRVSCSVETAVLSGFHDSIGLYKDTTSQELAIAREWLALFHLQDFATQPFHSLSYGQQRLALIARALVKQPYLAILDEPTQGLDDLNRHLVLACLERLASLKSTTLLFVSHREDEHIALFEDHLHFERDPDKSASYRIRKLS